MTSNLWNRTIKHFGEVRANQKLSFTFKYEGDDAYRSHNASCGCITSNWDKEAKTINMTITTSGITDIAKEAGRFYSDVIKSLTVNTVALDGVVTTHTLIIKAIVIDESLEI